MRRQAAFVIAALIGLSARAADPQTLMEVEAPGQMWMDEAGVLFMAAAEGVWRRPPGGEPERMPASPQREWPLLAGDRGTLAVAGMGSSRVVVYQGGAWALSPALGQRGDIVAISVDAQGVVQAVDDDGSLHAWAPGEDAWTRQLNRYASQLRAADLAPGGPGALYALGYSRSSRKTRSWLQRVVDGEAEEIPLHLEPGRGLKGAWFDAEDGSLWLLTSYSDLLRLDPLGDVQTWALPISGPLGALHGRRDDRGLTIAVRGGDEVLLFREGQVQRLGFQVRRGEDSPAKLRPPSRPDFHAPVLIDAEGDVLWTTQWRVIRSTVDPDAWRPLKTPMASGVKLQPLPATIRMGSGYTHRLGPTTAGGSLYLDLESRAFLVFERVYEGAANQEASSGVDLALGPTGGFSAGGGREGFEGDRLWTLGLSAGVLHQEDLWLALWSPSWVRGARGDAAAQGVRNDLLLEWALGIAYGEVGHQLLFTDAGPTHELRVGVGADLGLLILGIGLGSIFK